MKKEQLILKWLKGRVVVNLGSTVGDLHDYLKKNYKGKIIGVDIVGGPDIKCDLNKKIPLKSNYADAVVAGGIIEHMLNPYGFLKECHRVLKPGGRLIVTTPSGKCPFNPSLPGHIYSWDSTHNLAQLADRAGFMVVHHSYVDYGDRNPIHRIVYTLRMLRPGLFGVYEAVK